jgi:signal transduction histidine kinase
VEEELQAQALQLEETAAELELAVDELEEQKERALAAQADAERGASELALLVKRLEVLAVAGELLSSSLDFRATLSNLAALCSSTIADYCVTYLLEEDGSLQRVGAAHVDPRKTELMQRLLSQGTLTTDVDQVPARVVRTGAPVFADAVTDEMLQATAQNDDHLAVLRQLAPRSSIVVPLEARNRIIGAIAVATVEGGKRPFSEVDVTLLEEIARRAALAVDDLRLLHLAQEANRAKADFLAVMSHELRTPLNAIVGYVDLLDAEVRGPVTSGQREQLRRIERNATHLISMIGEILEFSRLEAGKETVHAAPVELRALAREAAEAIESVTIPRGLGFRLELPPRTVSATTDAAKVRQILLKLLSNAVKFTERGEVGLTFSTEGDHAVFRVHDTGVGIDPRDAANIFEPFWQVQRGPTRRAGGTGLGLTVTRRLALLLGGEITLESVPDEGSRFFLTLPLNAEVGQDRRSSSSGLPGFAEQSS